MLPAPSSALLTAANVAAPVRRVPFVLLGRGAVARAVLRRVLAAAGHWRARLALELRLVAVATSTDTLVSASHVAGDHAGHESSCFDNCNDDDANTALDIPAVLAWMENRLLGAPSGAALVPGRPSHALVRAIAGAGGIVVDCTATDAVVPLLREWVLSCGGRAVLANKRPLAGPLADFAALAGPPAGARVAYSACAGAGSPFVAALRRVVNSGDVVTLIEGALSGTLGMLSAGLGRGAPLSALVRAAHARGFTEPDPRDDLGGEDVARKALILARTAGWLVEPSAVKVKSLVPLALRGAGFSGAPAAFAAALEGAADAAMAARVAEMAASGCVPRYLARVSPRDIRVELVPVPADKPLARDTDAASSSGGGGGDKDDGGANEDANSNAAGMATNALYIYTEMLGPARPLVILGAGAGADVTAAGIVADMASLLVGQW
jgi:homoserine dehydrogenase